MSNYSPAIQGGPLSGRPFSERVKNAAHLKPLYELRSWDSRRGHSEHYDSVDMTLAIIDSLIASRQIDARMNTRELMDAMFPILTESDNWARDEGNLDAESPQQARKRQEKYLAKLIEMLAPMQGKLRAEYHDTDLHKRMTVQVAYLERREDTSLSGAGRIIVQPTTEAMNIYLGMMPRSVEDLQAASRGLIAEKLERGHFESARQEMEQAADASNEMREKVMALTRRIRHDLQSIDPREAWHELRGYQQHIERQVSGERNLLELVITQQENLINHGRRDAESERQNIQSRRELLAIQSGIERNMAIHQKLLASMAEAAAAYIDERRVQLPSTTRKPLPHLRRELLTPISNLDSIQLSTPLQGTDGTDLGSISSMIGRSVQLVRQHGFNLEHHLRSLIREGRTRQAGHELDQLTYQAKQEIPGGTNPLARQHAERAIAEAANQELTLEELLRQIRRLRPSTHEIEEVSDLLVQMALEATSSASEVGNISTTPQGRLNPESGYTGDNLLISRPLEVKETYDRI